MLVCKGVDRLGGGKEGAEVGVRGGGGGVGKGYIGDQAGR